MKSSATRERRVLSRPSATHSSGHGRTGFFWPGSSPPIWRSTSSYSGSSGAYVTIPCPTAPPADSARRYRTIVLSASIVASPMYSGRSLSPDRGESGLDSWFEQASPKTVGNSAQTRIARLISRAYQPTIEELGPVGRGLRENKRHHLRTGTPGLVPAAVPGVDVAFQGGRRHVGQRLTWFSSSVLGPYGEPRGRRLS